jgi:hypothetical protein
MSQTSKTPIHYTEIFQFYLYSPIALFQDDVEEEVIEDFHNQGIIPISFIREKSHPMFKRIAQDFREKELSSIILSIGYEKPYLA